MKRTDIAMIVLIAAFGMAIAYFATKAIMGDTTTKEVSVKKIEAINTTFPTPSPKIFNRDAINPTVEVQIKQGAQ